MSLNSVSVVYTLSPSATPASSFLGHECNHQVLQQALTSMLSTLQCNPFEESMPCVLHSCKCHQAGSCTARACPIHPQSWINEVDMLSATSSADSPQLVGRCCSPASQCQNASEPSSRSTRHVLNICQTACPGPWSTTKGCILREHCHGDAHTSQNVSEAPAIHALVEAKDGLVDIVIGDVTGSNGASSGFLQHALFFCHAFFFYKYLGPPM